MKFATPAALLAIPLATTFASDAAASFADPDPVTYTFSINPAVRLTEAFLFVASSSPVVQVVDLGTFAPGTDQAFTFTDNTFSSDENRIVFLGVYEEDRIGEPNFGIPGLSVSLIDQGSNNETNPTFESLFADVFFGEPEGAEDRIVTDLRTGSIVEPFNDGIGEFASIDPEGPAAEDFVQGFAFGGTPGFIDLPAIGFNEASDIFLGNFSTLTNGGTLSLTSVTVIPEPASFAMLGLGSLIIAGRRRRRH